MKSNQSKGKPRQNFLTKKDDFKEVEYIQEKKFRNLNKYYRENLIKNV